MLKVKRFLSLNSVILWFNAGRKSTVNWKKILEWLGLWPFKCQCNWLPLEIILEKKTFSFSVLTVFQLSDVSFATYAMYDIFSSLWVFTCGHCTLSQDIKKSMGKMWGIYNNLILSTSKITPGLIYRWYH